MTDYRQLFMAEDSSILGALLTVGLVGLGAVVISRAQKKLPSPQGPTTDNRQPTTPTAPPVLPAAPVGNPVGPVPPGGKTMYVIAPGGLNVLRAQDFSEASVAVPLGRLFYGQQVAVLAETSPGWAAIDLGPSPGGPSTPGRPVLATASGPRLVGYVCSGCPEVGLPAPYVLSDSPPPALPTAATAVAGLYPSYLRRTRR